MKKIFFLMLLAYSGWAQAQSATDSTRRFYKHHISVGILDPIFEGHTHIGHEFRIGKRLTMVNRLGIVGAGIINYGFERFSFSQDRGLFVQSAVRFWINRRYGRPQKGASARFKGIYFSPILSYTNYRHGYTFGDTLPPEINFRVNSMAILMSFGGQWKLSKTMTMGMQIGYGVEIWNMSDSDAYWGELYYGHVRPTSASRLAITSSFTLGYCFGK